MAQHKKKTKKNTSPKSRKNILAIVISLIVIAVFLATMFIQPPGRKARQQTVENSSSITVPEFRKDGSLSFYPQDHPDTVTIDIEVVDSQDEIMRGLMYRPYMPEQSGMLFVFKYEEERFFWMKNTYISLDIIYLNSQKEIVTIQANTQPLSTQQVPSNKPAKYVVEVNAGFAEKNHIKVGDRVSFEY